MNLQKHINKEENMFSKIEKNIAIIIIVVTILNIFLSVPLNNKVYAAKQASSGNMIAGASQDENGKYHGGKARGFNRIRGISKAMLLSPKGCCMKI